MCLGDKEDLKASFALTIWELRLCGYSEFISPALFVMRNGTLPFDPVGLLTEGEYDKALRKTRATITWERIGELRRLVYNQHGTFCCEGL